MPMADLFFCPLCLVGGPPETHAQKKALFRRESPPAIVTTNNVHLSFFRFIFFYSHNGTEADPLSAGLADGWAAFSKSFTFITCVVYLNHGFPTFILQ